MSVPRAPRALITSGIGVVRCALVVRLLDEWWSYLPAGTIDDQVRDLGLSYGRSGWLLALLTVGGLLGSPIAALADRGHRRALAIGGALTIAVALLAFAAAAPFLVLVVASLALGGASDVVLRPLESSMAELADGRLDRLLGRQHLITWVGDFVSPALLAIGAATALGWRGVFALTAAVFVGFAIVLGTVTFPPPAGDDDGEDDSTGSLRSIVRHPEVWWLTAAEFVLLPLDETFLGFAVARAAADGSNAAAQLLAGGVVVGGIAGSLIVTRHGLDRRRVSVGCALVVAGACVVAITTAMAAQVAGFAALGLGTAIVWAKVHHRTLTLIPNRSATVPTVVGLLSTPALAIPVAMGAVADEATITAALLGAAALSVLLAVAVLRLGGDQVAPDELDELD